MKIAWSRIQMIFKKWAQSYLQYNLRIESISRFDRKRAPQICNARKFGY